MELYLLRHGIAADHGPDGTDASRPLTEEGLSKMRLAARGMERLGVQPDLLLASPLVRAQQTAATVRQVLRREVHTANELAPGCTVARLVAALRPYPHIQRVLAVGHEPDLSEMVAALSGGSRVLMKKGGLARIDLAGLERGGGTLVWLLPPAALRAL